MSRLYKTPHNGNLPISNTLFIGKGNIDILALISDALIKQCLATYAQGLLLSL